MGVFIGLFCQGITTSELFSLGPVCSSAAGILHGHGCPPVAARLEVISSPLFRCRLDSPVFAWDIPPVLGGGGGCISAPLPVGPPILTTHSRCSTSRGHHLVGTPLKKIATENLIMVQTHSKDIDITPCVHQCLTNRINLHPPGMTLIFFPCWQNPCEDFRVVSRKLYGNVTDPLR